LGRTAGLLGVVDSAGTVIDRGCKQRFFTGSARVAATVLIRTCEHAGCRMPARFSQVDHDTEWAAGLGETIQSNSRIKCAPRNVFTPEHLWQTKRGANGHLHTIRADGIVMLPIGARPPDLSLELIEHFELDVLSGSPAPLSSIDDFWSSIVDDVWAATGFELATTSGN
jgi:hypothetical protein